MTMLLCTQDTGPNIALEELQIPTPHGVLEVQLGNAILLLALHQAPQTKSTSRARTVEHVIFVQFDDDEPDRPMEPGCHCTSLR